MMSCDVDSIDVANRNHAEMPIKERLQQKLAKQMP